MSKQRHISRLAAPRTWPIARKGLKWITKPAPGTHTLELSLPLNVILRDILCIANTNRDVKLLLNSKQVLVNNQTIRDTRFSVGIFDSVALPTISKYYRILVNNKGVLRIEEITKQDANILPLKIRDKTLITGGKTQINFTNGWNLLLNGSKYKTGDVILFDLDKRKPGEHLQLDRGSIVYFFAGTHSGKTAKLVDFAEHGKLRKHKVAIIEEDKNKFETSLDNLIVLGKDKPVIKL